jgi:hypothetical protein
MCPLYALKIVSLCFTFEYKGQGLKNDINVGFSLSFASIINFGIMIQHKNL